MTDQNTTTPSASQKQNEPSVEQVFTPAVDAFQGSAPQVPNAGAAPQAAPFSPAGGSSPLLFLLLAMCLRNPDSSPRRRECPLSLGALLALRTFRDCPSFT